MNIFKTTAIAAASAVVLSTAAFAGSMEEPVMEAPVIVEESSGSGEGWVVPLVIVALIAAVAASS